MLNQEDAMGSTAMMFKALADENRLLLLLPFAAPQLLRARTGKTAGYFGSGGFHSI